MIAKSRNGQISKADAMTPEQRASFLSDYRTVLLPVGFELWRFVSKQNDNRFGTFWMDVQTMQTIMETLHSTGIFSEKYKKENVRNNLAILQDWSNLSWRVKIRLLKEVVGYEGVTGSQKQFDEHQNDLPFGGGEKMEKVIETRIGRQTQYVIPRFRGLEDFNNWASIEHFAHI
jgi:hypothetical protein